VRNSNKISLQLFNWSVVILGRWNLAILTPVRLSKEVFKLEPQTQIKVAVPIDGTSPYLVEHPTQKIRVAIDVSRLVINLTEMNYQALKDAMVLVSGVSGKSQTQVVTFEIERQGMRLTLMER